MRLNTKKNMKRIIVNLKGRYPAKSKAVQRHAFDLGYGWKEACSKRCGQTIENETCEALVFEENGEITAILYRNQIPREDGSIYNVENFLEIKDARAEKITSEDIIEKAYDCPHIILLKGNAPYKMIRVDLPDPTPYYFLNLITGYVLCTGSFTYIETIDWAMEKGDLYGFKKEKEMFEWLAYDVYGGQI